MTGHDLFELIQAALGPEAHRHLGVDAPARRDTAIAGGSYRAPGALVDGFRAGDADVDVTGVVVAARASTAVLQQAAKLGANIVISRQAFLGDSQDRPVARPEPALRDKLALIAEHRLAVLRLQDPRIGPVGRAIAEALPRAIGLESAKPGLNLGDGLVYPGNGRRVLELARHLKSVLPTNTVRLVGDPGHVARGVAFATESSRPNALAPLISRPDVDLLVAGEVHETETTAYVLDAIAIGQPKALLCIGSIAMEEPAARELARRLNGIAKVPVHCLPSAEGLTDVAPQRTT